MFRSDLISELSGKLNIDQNQAKKLIENLGLLFAQTLSRREKIVIAGFGAFVSKKRVPKRIVDPNNPSQMMQLPERYVTKFVAGRTLKQRINQAQHSLVSQPLSQSPADVRPNLNPQSNDQNPTLTNLQPNQQPANQKDINQLVSELTSPSSTEPTRPTPSTIKPDLAVQPQPAPINPPQPQPTPQPIKPALKPDLTFQPSQGEIHQTPTPTFTPQVQAENKPIPEINLQPKPEINLKPQPKTEINSSSKNTAEPIITNHQPTGMPLPTPNIEANYTQSNGASKPVAPAPAQKPMPSVGAIHKNPSDVSFADLRHLKVAKEILQKLPEYIARLYQAVPISEKDGKLIVAMVDPEDFQAIEFIKKKIGQPIQPQIATQDDINKILEQYSGLEQEVETAIKGTEFAQEIDEQTENDEKTFSAEAPTSRVVQSILKKAVAREASDIHIEPLEKEVIVRYRLDGVLKKMISLPKTIQAGVVSRIKILSNIKIDEQRLPQDGRFQTLVDKKEIDFRVSTFPTIFGEKVVMRVLDKSVGLLSLEEVGLDGRAQKVVTEGVKKTHGMTLVTGPTGSGKTTTLYAVLGILMSEGVNMVTLEDPVEYQIQGINQGQVRPDIGFTFASGLRSIVRQDPDIIMVGEIRDKETAEMAVHAALTGHIVLSTLHTNDAAGAIPRLIDMGVEPFLLISSINTLLAQRLARKICDKCKVPTKVPQEMLDEIQKDLEALPAQEKANVKDLKTTTFYKGQGCQECNNTGYKGRLGIFEVLPTSEKINDLIVKKASSFQIQTAAMAEGMLTMKQDGVLKAIKGQTSLEEIWRVIRE